MNKKVLVLGASPKVERYSYMAVTQLLDAGYEVYPLGRDSSQIKTQQIYTLWPKNIIFDTISLYVSPVHQKTMESDIIDLMPRRIIFNPGAENPQLYKLVESKGIQAMNACTLVMLATGQF